MTPGETVFWQLAAPALWVGLGALLTLAALGWASGVLQVFLGLLFEPLLRRINR